MLTWLYCDTLFGLPVLYKFYTRYHMTVTLPYRYVPATCLHGGKPPPPSQDPLSPQWTGEASRDPLSLAVSPYCRYYRIVIFPGRNHYLDDTRWTVASRFQMVIAVVYTRANGSDRVLRSSLLDRQPTARWNRGGEASQAQPKLAPIQGSNGYFRVSSRIGKILRRSALQVF